MLRIHERRHPTRRCASATTCNANVVFPPDSGP
jgi:hypothetical protein